MQNGVYNLQGLGVKSIQFIRLPGFIIYWILSKFAGEGEGLGPSVHHVYQRVLAWWVLPGGAYLACCCAPSNMHARSASLAVRQQGKLPRPPAANERTRNLRFAVPNSYLPTCACRLAQGPPAAVDVPVHRQRHHSGGPHHCVPAGPGGWGWGTCISVLVACVQ